MRRELSRLVVASEEVHAVRIGRLETVDDDETLDGELSAVDVVAEEEVLVQADVRQHLQHLVEVVELSAVSCQTCPWMSAITDTSPFKFSMFGSLFSKKPTFWIRSLKSCFRIFPSRNKCSLIVLMSYLSSVTRHLYSDRWQETVSLAATVGTAEPPRS